jgi:hypothetical protein
MSEREIKEIKIPHQDEVTIEQVATEYFLDPKTLGALAVDGNTASVSTQVDMEFARGVIGKGIEEIRRGDLSNLEAMLYSQAVALNMMFTSLSRRASIQHDFDIKASITSLALKSQNQSRNTIQTLINLKQPNQTAFIKQQTNVANGHQQINNGVTQLSPEKLLNQQNELLEVNHVKWLDRGKKAKTKGVNTELEALGEVHRGKNSSRKGKV